jgi:hypothetical protein
MKSENESREESYQRVVKLFASYKPDPTFRSLGDMLSDGAMMVTFRIPGGVPYAEQLLGALSGGAILPRAQILRRMLPVEFSQVYFRGQAPIGGWPERFAVVTAHNPEGVVNDPSANETADQSLREEIEKIGLTHFRVTGGSLDGRHQEPGWGIVLATPELARDLSERFKQLAYFWVENGQLSLVDTQAGERLQQGAWLDRWLG